MLTAVLVAQAAAIVLLGVLVAGLLRSHAEILRALHDLGAGLDEPRPDDFRVTPGLPSPGASADPAARPAADVTGVAPGDEAVAVAVAGVSHPTLLAFLSSGCLTCAGFWDAFRDPDRLGLPEGTRLVVVTRGPDEESESRIAELAGGKVAVVMSTAAWDAYEVPGSPYFVAVDGPTRRVTGEGTATSWEQVTGLLGTAEADAATRRRGRGRSGDRATRADRELLAAGIGPGHPSLYPEPEEAEPPP